MKKVILNSLIVIWLMPSLCAQNASRYQALFVYNFTRYIEWPSSSSHEFVIGILGKSKVYDELQSISQGKSIGMQAIAIKKMQNIDECSSTACSILFVSSEASSQVAQLASKLTNNNTLIITERSGLVNKGAAISFVLDDEGKQKFEINKSNLERSGLKVNKSLLDMAIN